MCEEVEDKEGTRGMWGDARDVKSRGGSGSEMVGEVI